MNNAQRAVLEMLRSEGYSAGAALNFLKASCRLSDKKAIAVFSEYCREQTALLPKKSWFERLLCI